VAARQSIVIIVDGLRPTSNPLSHCLLQVKADENDDDTAALALAPSHSPIQDASQAWEKRARAAYAQDGDDGGYDSDGARGGGRAGEEDTHEARYMREHPDVPVVERLQDMWQVHHPCPTLLSEGKKGRSRPGRDLRDEPRQRFATWQSFLVFLESAARESRDKEYSRPRSTACPLHQAHFRGAGTRSLEEADCLRLLVALPVGR
jgi:hypothetical protein